MSKVLKTGDLKKVRREDFAHGLFDEDWAVVWDGVSATAHYSRESARKQKNYWGVGRIARVLSIGPKLVTVRIEK